MWLSGRAFDSTQEALASDSSTGVGRKEREKEEKQKEKASKAVTHIIKDEKGALTLNGYYH